MWLIFIICCYSMASIIVEQKIFEEPREWLKSCTLNNPNWFMRKICALISCMWCTGVWCGMILCLLGLNIVNINEWDFFFSGLLSGFTTYMMDRGMQLIDKVMQKYGIEA
jgi:hypothetical protein